MSKRVQTVGIMMALMALPSGVVYASTSPAQTVAQNVQQDADCKGVVIDATGEPVIGASVVVKGKTGAGTVTDIDGNFTLKNVKKGETLRITSLGMTPVEVVYNGSNVKVTLKDDSKALDEVVVTALGIKRERKSLGYAIQDVKGDAILNSHENNVANALTGKIAGVQITRSSNGPGGSSKIQLRGNNSVTGLNQPLIVVDGVPMDNFTGADNNDYWNPSADMGNGLSDINPEDIESMSVLKGASAAALYGSRAGNGVILITTKSGRQTKGLGITVTGTVSAESIFMKPDVQTTYGQGTQGVYNSTSGLSWGPRIEGQEYVRWDGQKVKMQSYDNLDNYYGTGTELQENVTLSQQYGKTSIYASMTNMNNKSMTPGAKLNRTNLMLRGVTSFGKNDAWTFDGKVQYIRNKANNRPVSGNNNNNSALGLFTFPTTLDIRDFENCIDENNEMVWWNKDGNNPYWMSKYSLSDDSRDRFLMNASLKYKVLSWLTAEIKAGTDMYTLEATRRVYSGNSNVTTLYEQNINHFYENNFSYLLTATKDNIFDKFGGTVTFGGNLMATKKTGMKGLASKLVIPNKFSLNNGENKADISETYTQKKINSLYGTVGINYDGWAFLDATFRNDWSSALSKENRSFFYPSVSASWLFGEMFNKIGKKMPSWFSFGKIRASYAEVGNDMDPYQLYNLYSTSPDSHGGITASSSNTLYNKNVKNELIKSYEVGVELKFLNNRLGLDFAWYKSNATNQLMNLPVNSLSGYNYKKINAGDIQNTGVELMAYATPIRTKDFEWTINYNISHNNNTIKDLYDGVDRYQLGGYDNIRIYAIKGGKYGEIWGTKFLRVEDGQYKGQLLLTSDGLPQATSEMEKIGDQQATCNMGLTNSFSYKGWNLSFQIDARIGGEIFSGTNAMMQRSGTAAATAPGGKRVDDMVVAGVYKDANGNYVQNTNKVTTQQYWNAVAGTGNMGIGEANIYSASNIRLRNVSLGYNVPTSILAKTNFIQSLKAGFTVTNVFMIHSNMNGIDPESVFATSTNATGFEYAGIPTTRSFVFNVSIGF
ncbi:SusC/RagA family TonB-linked outer membrane protein [uncultured Prevotella sp.]|uniref:SusC/RagA family TonB-linked outer membrane protein n=1 Tax=uncultured Prevotella sp. TaxID=159272 RepID=UPI0027E26ABA|nr:SusC/RagA family TonB-linked outer membrane protein [uncultured Prevotella sp.]